MEEGVGDLRCCLRFVAFVRLYMARYNARNRLGIEQLPGEWRNWHYRYEYGAAGMKLNDSECMNICQSPAILPSSDIAYALGVDHR